MTKQCIEKTIYDIDYQKLFPDISSPANIWNESDDKNDEEKSLSNDYTEFSDHIYSIISNVCNQIEKHINTDYAVTGWMLFVFPQISKDVSNAQKKHNIQVNTVINSLFSVSTEKELHETLDTFWIKYTWLMVGCNV